MSKVIVSPGMVMIASEGASTFVILLVTLGVLPQAGLGYEQ